MTQLSSVSMLLFLFKSLHFQSFTEKRSVYKNLSWKKNVHVSFSASSIASVWTKHYGKGRASGGDTKSTGGERRRGGKSRGGERRGGGKSVGGERRRGGEWDLQSGTRQERWKIFRFCIVFRLKADHKEGGATGTRDKNRDWRIRETRTLYPRPPSLIHNDIDRIKCPPPFSILKQYYASTDATVPSLRPPRSTKYRPSGTRKKIGGCVET